MLGKSGPEGQPSASRQAPAGLALVLGAGGVRGIAHVGVLERLLEEGVRPAALVGTSIGALVAAVHAALGWDAGRLRALALGMGPLAMLDFVLLRPMAAPLAPLLALRRPWLSPILAEMGDRGFEDLAPGVRALGMNCLEARSGRELFFATGGAPPRPALRQAVLASTALPVVCPSVRLRLDGSDLRLVDGGLSRTLCIEEALTPPIAAHRALAVDLGVLTGFRERALDHRARLHSRWGDRLRILRPDLDRFGTILMRRGDPERMLEAGRRAVDAATLAWCREAAEPVDPTGSLI